MDNIFAHESGVLELTSKDFKIKNKKVYVTAKHFKDKKAILVIYAPWCGHCLRSVPLWCEIATLFKNVFPIGAVNVENEIAKNNKIKHALNVKFYPSIFTVSKSGLVKPYKKGRDVDDILEHILVSIKH